MKSVASKLTCFRRTRKNVIMLQPVLQVAITTDSCDDCVSV